MFTELIALILETWGSEDWGTVGNFIIISYRLILVALQRYAVRFSPTNILVTIIKTEFETIKKSGPN